MLCVMGFDHCFTRVPSFTKTLGWRAEEVLEKPFLDFVHPDDRDSSHREATVRQEARRDTVEFENRYLCKDGTYKWISWNSHPLPDKGLVIGVGRDITERKHADEALRKSEERFRNLFELGLIGMAITSPVKGFVEVNDRICEILGYERAELARKDWAELAHPDRPRCRCRPLRQTPGRGG